MARLKQNVPEIRFEGFSDEYNKIKMIDIVKDKKLSNGVFNDPSKVGKGYKLINVLNMYETPYVTYEKLTLLDLEKTDFRKNQVFDGDIFFTRSSLVKEGIAWNNVYFGSYDDVTFDGHLIKLSPDRKKFIPLYLHYNFRSSFVRRQIISVSKTGSMTTIGQSDISGINVLYPEIEEQTQIGIFFQQLDRLIELQTRAVEIAERHKKAMLQKLFPQKGEKVPRIRFAGFSGDWEETVIGYIADIKRGASPRPISDPKWFDDNSSIGWVRISDVTRSFRVLERTEQYLSAEGVKKSRLIKAGSIIMSICATIGKPVYTAFDVCIHDGFVVFDDLKIDADYTLYFLQKIQKKWYQYGQPGTQVNLNSDIVSQEKIIYPSLDEQIQIGDFFQKLDEKITSEQRKLARYQMMKRAMLQRMFV